MTELHSSSTLRFCAQSLIIEIMHLVASVCPFICALTAEPSEAKSNKSHYHFKVFVCVSVISGHMRIIARMRLVGVLMIQYLLRKVSVPFIENIGYQVDWLGYYNRQVNHHLMDGVKMNT